MILLVIMHPLQMQAEKQGLEAGIVELRRNGLVVISLRSLLSCKTSHHLSVSQNGSSGLDEADTSSVVSTAAQPQRAVEIRIDVQREVHHD